MLVQAEEDSEAKVTEKGSLESTISDLKNGLRKPQRRVPRSLDLPDGAPRQSSFNRLSLEATNLLEGLRND